MIDARHAIEIPKLQRALRLLNVIVQKTAEPPRSVEAAFARESHIAERVRMILDILADDSRAA
jgi:hypothetical protein